MSSNKPKSNPWCSSTSPSKLKKPLDLGKPEPNPYAAGPLKFKEAQAKLQNAVQKHLKDCDSSSEEEDVKSSDLLDNILEQYRSTGGTSDQSLRTQIFIQESFLSGANTCLICISRIKREDKIWSCFSCFGAFHLNCIQRWSKDTVMQQKQRIEDQTELKKRVCWCCPKCRADYSPDQYPTKYVCFCGKLEDPKFQPFLVAHSCGEICRKELLSVCGHKCLLLCHPGPCPPCPVTVTVPCFCGSQPPSTKRCCNRGWSCGNRCGRALSCGKHDCSDECHSGDCNPCSKKSIQKCMCGSQQKLRDCSSPIWQCEKVCGKLLDCGKDTCQEICHAGVCDSCPLSKPRTCPCGKTNYLLPCTDETPTCGSTCDKLLECKLHTCNYRCHKDKCGLCLEIVTKSCRCGQHSKEIQCCKQYLCDTKCKKMKDCNKHPCNRKCCDGNCPPCEKPCGNSLQCSNHKCPSVCHRGPCYPCQLFKEISCRCGATKMSVPCGRKQRVKPPKCLKLCMIPPDCHHEKRDEHRCHFGDCPACKQICNKTRPICGHPCPVKCHSAVLVKVETQKATMPWEQSAPQLEKRDQPCPACLVPVPVTCVGGHETADWPCHLPKPSSCGRPCGRLLSCTNHSCSLLCHTVEDAPNSLKAGENCEKCENPCTKSRPEDCTHECPKPCHPGSCPPCKQMLRIKCHCALTQPYVPCGDWLDEAKREELQSCGNQCPKNYICGHRCKSNCHSGDCPNPELCKKKMKVTCKCRRLKKEFQCETIRKGLAIVKCDEVCLQKQAEDKKKRDVEDEIRKKEEDLKNQKELEMYQKKFAGKKKNREKKIYADEDNGGFIGRYWVALISLFIIVTSVIVYQALR
ncbi:NF-X1-type zinc finger protein NFXL1 [Euwallacea similis]|uniref:NF-X1-type zinc finger protein NFXL1 n=1 Tax=Euwallacea similis TaxID=1736056 RepID=UPI00344B6821